MILFVMSFFHFSKELKKTNLLQIPCFIFCINIFLIKKIMLIAYNMKSV
jgi:hypothetical protein